MALLGANLKPPQQAKSCGPVGSLPAPGESGLLGIREMFPVILCLVETSILVGPLWVFGLFICIHCDPGNEA